MTTKRGICSSMLLLAVACTPAKDNATSDTTPAATTLPPIDTLKVATDSMPPRDTTSLPVRGTTPVAGTKTGTKTAASTKTGRDSIIGYDKATPLDPNKKLLDTVKKRP